MAWLTLIALVVIGVLLNGISHLQAQQIALMQQANQIAKAQAELLRHIRDQPRR